MKTMLENEIGKRFGVLPNFFRLGSSDPNLTKNLWGFAQFGYLDNPLPSLFKERLFVYLSRFCEVRYCIARHLGFLVGLGHPAGDSACLPQKVEGVMPLLLRPLVHGDELRLLIAVCDELESPLSSFPAPDSPGEQALFACATHVFLQTPDASQAHEALRRVFGTDNLEPLNLLLAFVRLAHYWTRLHPELVLEEDITQLLTAHEALAHCVLNDPEAHGDSLSRQVAADLASLRNLRHQHANMTQAYHELTVDHQAVKHSLHEKEENLRELVATMPAAVYACDSQGMVTYYNRQSAEIWGGEPGLNDGHWSFLDSRSIYRTDGTLLPPHELPTREVLATGLPVVNRELVLERPDLSRIEVLANVAPLRDDAGRVTGTVNIFQDVTELKLIRQERERLLGELLRSNTELSRFSFAVSHDLRAPVCNIRSLIQFLRDDMGAGDRAELLAMIEKAAIRMDALVESLLKYAQVGAGQLNWQRVPMDPVIDSVRMTLGPLISKTGARIVAKLLPAVEGDQVLLEQLLQNLIANAIHYRRAEEAPVVEISGEPAEGGWQFAVADNGSGIVASHHEDIFEPLKRLHGSDTPGSGLGLALCRTIVARHGGRIWVESEGPNCGATFRFTLSSARESQAIRNETAA